MLMWLADVLREAGCKVVETKGWHERGRGDFVSAKGVLCHHTGPGSKEGLIDLITKGRADLPGPLSQLFLDEDGTFYVIAAGRCNHAGKGRWHGVDQGNYHLIGIEARNAGDGKDIWEPAQMQAYQTGVAAILKHIGVDALMVAGHKEYALPKGRKIDPSFNMIEFREGVENMMQHLLAGPVATVQPKQDMLRKGDMGNAVLLLQSKLKIKMDGNFGPNTEAAVKNFQLSHGLTVDGLVGPATWKELGE